MKKYIKPSVDVFSYQAEGTIATSSVDVNTDLEGQGSVLVNGSDMWGKEGMWN